MRRFETRIADVRDVLLLKCWKVVKVHQDGQIVEVRLRLKVNGQRHKDSFYGIKNGLVVMETVVPVSKI
jgi:hypothetical protein